jgi:general secretion pathway protein D
VNFLKICNIWVFIVALICLSGGPLVNESCAQTPNEDRISLDIKDIELTELIKTISELTGKNFLYDDNVKGKVTIITPEVMTLDEIYQLFLTVLNVKGYTLIPSGKMNKIVSVKNASQENLPLRYSGSGIATEQYITRLVRLDYLDVDTVAKSVLAPLMPATGTIFAVP